VERNFHAKNQIDLAVPIEHRLVVTDTDRQTDRQLVAALAYTVASRG